MVFIEDNIVRTIHIRELDNFEEVLNKVFLGVQGFKKRNPEYIVKVTYNSQEITIKYIRLDGSSN